MALSVKELTETLNLKIIAGENGLANTVKNVYIGDLLSWVMGNATEGDAWITIQGHVNIAAVALLTNVSCVIVCESAEVAAQTIEKANLEDIPLLTSELPAYELAIKMHEVLL